MLDNFIIGYFKQYRCDDVDDLIRQLEEFKDAYPNAVGVSAGVWCDHLEEDVKQGPTLHIVK